MSRLILGGLVPSLGILVAAALFAQELTPPTPPTPPTPQIQIQSGDGFSPFSVFATQTLEGGGLINITGASNDPAITEAVERERELDAQSHALLSQYRKATDSEEQEHLEGELRKVLADQFTAKQSIREQEITQLENEIQRLRAVLQQRAEQGERIVEDRLQQLLRDASGLGWGDDGHLGKSSSLRGFSFRGQPSLPNFKKIDVDVASAIDAAHAEVDKKRKEIDKKRAPVSEDIQPEKF